MSAEHLQLLKTLFFMAGIVLVLMALQSPKLKPFNREFTVFLIGTLFLFDGAISSDIWLTLALTYLGVRTGQKYLEQKNGIKETTSGQGSGTEANEEVKP